MPTPRAPIASRETPRPGADALACPGCGAVVRVAADQLLEGAPTRCLKCRADLVLTREFDEGTRQSRWMLAEAPGDEEAQS